jgi:hypothetical protein
MKGARPAMFALFLTLLTGCGSALKPAIQAYEGSRYPEAMAELGQLNEATGNGAPEIQLRYALYRGLTHLALGDARRAEVWLTRVQRGDQRLLSAADLGRFAAAWRSLGHMPGEVPPQRATRTVSMAP